MKLNNKGYTLVELLIVICLLSIIMAIIIPSSNYLLKQNKNNNYKQLETNIINAAKLYVSDNRYDIVLDYNKETGLCQTTKEENISQIGTTKLSSNKLLLNTLVEEKYLSTNSKKIIKNPLNDNQSLDLNNSYILIKYQCNKKDYIYTLEHDSLIWK